MARSLALMWAIMAISEVLPQSMAQSNSRPDCSPVQVGNAAVFSIPTGETDMWTELWVQWENDDAVYPAARLGHLPDEIASFLHDTDTKQATSLRCASGSYHSDCDVVLTGAKLVNTSCVELALNLPTTMPAVGSVDRLQEYFQFEGPWWSRATYAAWASPSTLLIVAADPEATSDDQVPTTLPPGSNDSVTLLATDRLALFRKASKPFKPRGSPKPSAIASARLLAPAELWAVDCVAASLGIKPPRGFPAEAVCASGLGKPARIRLVANATFEARKPLGCPEAPSSAFDLLLSPAAPSTADASSAATALSMETDPVAAFPAACEGSQACSPPRNVLVFAAQSHTQVTAILDLQRRPNGSANSANTSASLALRRNLLPEAPNGPAVAVRGVFGTGSRGVRLAPRSLPLSMQTHGDFSVCAWVWLDEREGDSETFQWRQRHGGHPTGAGFRTLFFKGWGQDQQRTPSVWIVPGSNKLLVGISLPSNPAHASESRMALPWHSWTHVCVTGHNHTHALWLQQLLRQNAASSPGSSNSSADNLRFELDKETVSYNLALYINGNMDTFLQARGEPVVANTGPLWIGRDPSFGGARMLVAGLRMFERGLGSAEVASLFAATAPGMHAADGVVRGGRADPLPWSKAMERELYSAGPDTTGWTAQELRVVVGATAAVTALRSLGPAAFSGQVAPSQKTGTAPQLASLTPVETQDMTSRADAMLADCAIDAGAAVDLLEEACGEGDGDGAACGRLAAWVLNPGRVACPGEVDGSAGDDGFAVVAVDGEAASNPTRSVFRRDVPRAVSLFAHAAAHGDCDAVFQLGVLTATGLISAARSNETVTAAAAGIAALLGGRSSARASSAGLDPLVVGASSPSDAEAAGYALLGTGLLHVAAACGSVEASYALAVRYRDGIGGIGSVDHVTAAHYAVVAAQESEQVYTQVGTQPLHEMHRLTPETVETVMVSQAGEADGAIEAQRRRAEHGDVDAMLNMGDLYYWGARGMPRDQQRARGYFVQAAEAGNVQGKTAAAGMMLKGEGGPRDNATGTRLYQEAAAVNHTAALNGLGFAYFHGQGVARNVTLAKELFCRARDTGHSPDGAFNCARCHEMGDADSGVPPNARLGRQLLHSCATGLGHFSCIFRTGVTLATGLPSDDARDVPSPAEVAATVSRAFIQSVAHHSADPNSPALLLPSAPVSTGDTAGALTGWASLSSRATAPPGDRAIPNFSADLSIRAIRGASSLEASPDVSAASALPFLSAAAEVGPWARALRAAFDRYRLRDYDGALLIYVQAWAMGYELGAANAGYLLRRRLVTAAVVPLSVADVVSRRGYASSFARDTSGSTSARPLAELYLEGRGGLVRDARRAASLFSRAAASGNAQAAFSLAMLFDAGATGVPRSEDRALRFLHRVLETTEPGQGHELPVYAAIARIHARRLCRQAGLRLAMLEPAESSNASSGVDLVSAWLGWSLDVRGDSESLVSDKDGYIGRGVSYGDVTDLDAGSAIGDFRGQSASIRWLLRELQSRLHWSVWLGVIAIMLLAAASMVLCCAACYRCHTVRPE